MTCQTAVGGAGLRCSQWEEVFPPLSLQCYQQQTAGGACCHSNALCSCPVHTLMLACAHTHTHTYTHAHLLADGFDSEEFDDTETEPDDSQPAGQWPPRRSTRQRANSVPRSGAARVSAGGELNPFDMPPHLAAFFEMGGPIPGVPGGMPPAQPLLQGAGVGSMGALAMGHPSDATAADGEVSIRLTGFKINGQLHSFGFDSCGTGLGCSASAADAACCGGASAYPPFGSLRGCTVAGSGLGGAQGSHASPPMHSYGAPSKASGGLAGLSQHNGEHGGAPALPAYNAQGVGLGAPQGCASPAGVKVNWEQLPLGGFTPIGKMAGPGVCACVCS